MKHIVLGTAGHVDHGKTSLVKALTGIDTDRLKEEKERGITIELGFASLRLPGGMTLGIVDVPGHERFIKNMVAGASGVDLLLLVIAADEGVMPQTREHLHICTLLGIRKGLVALTKIDMVDEDWRALVMDDVQQYLQGTFLAGAPVVPVSAVTGAGLPELVAALESLAAEVEEKRDHGIFRLPVDRVFSMKGFGTVVTGTLISGSIGVGDDIEILPTGVSARIRTIQVHNQTVERAAAGQRTAINLQGVERAAVERGEVMIRPGTVEVSRRLDVLLDYLESNEKVLKNRSLVRFHVGTRESLGRVILLDREEALPGERVYGQIIFEAPVVVMAGDHFVIRSYSPITTTGGGIILDPLPRKHKRKQPAVTEEFRRLAAGTGEERVAVITARSGYEGVNISRLVMRTGLPEGRLRKIVEAMLSARQAVLLDSETLQLVDGAVYASLQEQLRLELLAYHGKNPLREGMQKEELRMTVGAFIPGKLFNKALKDLERQGRAVLERETVRLAEHRVRLEEDLETLKEQILAAYLSAGLAPPTVKELYGLFPDRGKQVDSVRNILLREGKLVKVNEDLLYHREVLDGFQEQYREMLLRDGRVTPVTFKELTNLSRKFIIPLMEYFDAVKMTVRSGDHRILREKR
ncbi:MAG TPA: selenocysteine-specific translation elongation factor [Syntrophales bacterium]|nr:selenocysteine-specific translation elongation factor [Syntrophales bacterium]